MQSALLITFATLFAQAAGQTSEKLGDRAREASSLGSTDLDFTTLAKARSALVRAPALIAPLAFIPPATAQNFRQPEVMPRQPAQIFQLAAEEKAAKKDDAAPAEEASAKKEEVKLEIDRKWFKNFKAPANVYTVEAGNNANMKEWLAAYKQNCFTKGCGGAQGKFSELSDDVVNVPVVALISLLVSIGVVLVVRRFRTNGSTMPEDTFVSLSA